MSRTETSDLSARTETSALAPAEDKTLLAERPEPTPTFVPVVLAHPCPEGEPGDTVTVPVERAAQLLRSGYARPAD